MRLIDADELYEEHTRLAYEGDYAFHITARAWLENAPTVDAVPAVRGEWKETPTKWIYCSVCGSEPPEESNYKSNYCPNCGAKMDGGVNDEVD